MKLHIEIDTGNAAFDDDPKAELLKVLWPKVWYAYYESLTQECGISRRMLDTNGNAVGTIKTELEH
jgi:hypothetical protein